MKQFLIALLLIISLKSFGQPPKYDSLIRPNYIMATGYLYKIVGAQDGGVLLAPRNSPDKLAWQDSGAQRYHHGRMEFWNGIAWGPIGSNEGATPLVADNNYLEFSVYHDDTLLLSFSQAAKDTMHRNSLKPDSIRAFDGVHLYSYLNGDSSLINTFSGGSLTLQNAFDNDPGASPHINGHDLYPFNLDSLHGMQFVSYDDMVFNTSPLANINLLSGSQLNLSSGNNSINFLVNGFKSGYMDPILSTTYFGYKSGASNDNVNGVKNTGFGYEAMMANTTATENTGIGYQALRSTTTGGSNTAVGRISLANNETGVSNTAIGTGSLGAIIAGSYNTGIGSEAFGNGSTGSYNTVVGYGSLVQSGGDENTSIGAAAGGQTASNSSRNIFIGSYAGYDETGNDKLYIGSTFSRRNTPIIFGNLANGFVGIGTITPDETFVVNGSMKGGVLDGVYGQGLLYIKPSINLAVLGDYQGSHNNVFITVDDGSNKNIDLHTNEGKVTTDGNVGIGTTTPDSGLTLLNKGFKYDVASKGAGKVLTSDANGAATWQTPSGGGTSITFPNTALKYYTGYGTFGSLNDTTRAAISVTNTGSGGASYSSSTGVISVPQNSDSIQAHNTRIGSVTVSNALKAPLSSPTFTGTLTADSIKPLSILRFPQTAGATAQSTAYISFNANSTSTVNGISWGSNKGIYSNAANGLTISATVLNVSGTVVGSAFQATGAGNTNIALSSTTATISKTNADANTGVVLSNSNASATGNIAAFSSSISSTAVTVSRSGLIGQYGTAIATGTTGAQTINKPVGTVNFAAGATSLVVTNSLVTTSTPIQCTIQTNDATMKSVQCVPGSGSFTIYANAASTGETKVYFEVKAIN